MAKRKGISKSVRFEVFKRDSFKCQYCGRGAPDVLLHVDHIKPVAKGGSDEIMNYVTACADCNLGKGANALDDNSAVRKQRSQLEELNERRAQLEMMIAWREGLGSLEEAQVSAATQKIELALGWYGLHLSDTGQDTVRLLVRRCGLDYVLQAIPAAEMQIDREKTPENGEKLFRLIQGIARTRKRSEKQPHLQDMYYIRGILRRRLDYVNEAQCLEILDEAITSGIAVDDLKHMAKTSESWTEFRDWVRVEIGGEPF